MGSFRFVHAADLHLDSPLRGLDRYEGVPAELFRGATRRALVNLVDLCLAEKADFLLVAGDVYDGNWRDYRTGLFFHAQLSRLGAAGIPVFLIRGNHDAESEITRTLRLPENARQFATGEPQSDRDTLERLGVVVHGQGFATRAVQDDLASAYPAAVPGCFNIGLLHTALDGRPGHDPYAPTRLDILRARGYDYWALGHVHRREVVCQQPWVVFPGNLQGRHARELGAKGATLVTVEAGRVRSVEARPLDAVRWIACEVDLAAAASADDALDQVRSGLRREAAEAGGRPLAARVVLRGRSAAHAAIAANPERFTSEVRAAATDVGEAPVWIERVEVLTGTLLDLEGLARRDDVIGELTRALHELGGDDAALAEVFAGFDELRRRLPAELCEGPEALALGDPWFRRKLLAEVEQLLVPRLLEGPGET